MNGVIEFAEVLYYFLDRDSGEPGEQIAYALLSFYGPPDQDMLDASSHTLYACQHEGNDLRCVPVKDIESVVSMQPLPPMPGDPENLWFVIEKSGLDDVQLFDHEVDED